jgi:importin-5
MGQADKIFVYVAQALEADMLGTGEVAQRVVTAAKTLMQSSGVNAQSLLQQFSPEAQQTILRYFS